MTDVEARMYVRGLTVEGHGFEAGRGVKWKEPLHIATDVFSVAAANRLSREPVYDTTDYSAAPNHGVGLIEIYLTEPLPDTDRFYGIFAVDDFGIWFADSPFTTTHPVERQRVIPWRYVKGLVVHTRS